MRQHVLNMHLRRLLSWGPWKKRPLSRRKALSEVEEIFLDPSGACGNVPLSGERCPEWITAGCRRLGRVVTKGALLRGIASEAEVFSLRDLERMIANFQSKTRDLPDAYRNSLEEKVKEQITGSHHALILLSRKEFYAGEDGPLPPLVPEYFLMVEEACREKAAGKDPKLLYLKYLLAAFTMFIEEKPAHPVGTPFPGGQIVGEWDGDFFCPVRDMADGVPFALCPFCPATQGPEPFYPETKRIKKRHERRESLENYRTNFKG